MIKVVGITTNNTFYVGSKERNFRMNEFLAIDDEAQGRLLGEVVEAQTYNRFIPLDIGGDFVDSSVLISLKSLGYDLSEDTIYIAKVRLLKEAKYPVLTGSDVNIPSFEELKPIIAKTSREKGLTIGIIKNTEVLYDEMDEELKGVLETFEEEKTEPQKDVPFILNINSMHEYPHIGIFGGSGSGKSFGLRVLLEELMKKKIPTIVLDPHYEMEFGDSSNYDFKDKYNKFMVGRDIGVQFSEINGMELKIMLSAVSDLTESMEATVDIIHRKGGTAEGLEALIDNLIEAIDLGRDSIQKEIEMASGEELSHYVHLEDLLNKYERKVNIMSLRGIGWRLKQLINQGIFNRNIDLLLNSLMEGKLVVVQGSTKLINTFSTYLLNKTYRLRRDYKDSLSVGGNADYFVPFIIVTDEAHNFAPKAIPSPTKSVLREISQEGRKYGVFLVLATQRPTLLDETITAQLNTKFIFRTVRAQDIDTIRSETDISPEESKRLPYLTTGDVFVSSAELGRTQYVRIRKADTTSPHKENPFDELKTMRNKLREDEFKIVEDYLPIEETNLMMTAKNISASKGYDLSVEDLKGILERLEESGLVVREKGFLGDKYLRKEN
ncbi:ATP-binding protein [Peptoniphilus sp. BV3AC2]|uniref:ATP-binding protein n=1 Tax=Peptoniphilus sp. BV3AC2 TaxID=1111133 RepID=UPI0003B8669A|nr:ATP-binding protein [Peptoniphilus sp. BV3AC2]ERT65005.1 PF01935 domain protein [Peptoniphilus sp. BV3AC2]